MTSTGTCKALTRSGKPCQSFTTIGSDFCIVHDPAWAGRMAAARRKGGAARHGRKVGRVETAPAVALGDLPDVLALLERAVNDVLTLENSINRARAVGYLASAWGTLYESSELERRIAALEAHAMAG